MQKKNTKNEDSYEHQRRAELVDQEEHIAEDNSVSENSKTDSLVLDEERSLAGNDNDDGPHDNENCTATNIKKKKKTKKPFRLSLEKTEKSFNQRLKKRGVLYLARIPPKLTPTKIKLLLSGFGAEVTRVYLEAEDAAVRKRRKAGGGGGGKRYTEGWVEMSCKKVAKRVAAALNCTPMASNNKRDTHCNDLWNIKYLSKFQWSHLTEKVAYERRVREQKLRLETMQARRDVVHYKKLVESGQKMDKIEQRLKRKRQRDGQLDKHVNDKKHTRQSSSHRQVQPLSEDGPNHKSLAKNGLLGSLV